MSSSKKNAIGQVFGRWLVLANTEPYITPKGKKYTRYKCVCDCGAIGYPSRSSLVSGQSKSCGCLQKEVVSKLNKTTHGMSGTRLYNVWCGMKSRCYCESKGRWERYGGRGITVCDEWRDCFTLFHNWAMENGYTDNLTIDRIDNNKGYEPSNCQFITNEANVRKMIKEHKEAGTGGYSKSAHKKMKITQTLRYGRKIRVFKTGETYTFHSVREGAKFMSEKLNRSFDSCRAQIMLVLNPNNVCKSLAGYSIEEII